MVEKLKSGLLIKNNNKTETEPQGLGFPKRGAGGVDLGIGGLIGEGQPKVRVLGPCD